MNEVSWPLMHNNITRSDLDSIIEYLKLEDPKLTQGPMVNSFEKNWSQWLGVKHSIMLNSGSSANDLTMIALRELNGPGEIIVPPLTWVSDISAVMRSGLTPVFVDIDPETLAMDNDLILKSINSKTRAVFLSHILGYNGLTNKLLESLKNAEIPLIEDVCESHGATHEGKKLGTFGWASNFSFYYAHHMTTIEGGMISTNDSELYEILLMLRSHGMVRESSSASIKEKYYSAFPDLNPDFIFAYAAHNMRSTEINAVLGMEQLRRLDESNLKRTENLLKFLSVINPNVFRTNFKVQGSSNYAFTLILIEPNFAIRDRVESKLRAAGIEFRRGLSGGGNQLRQPYLKNVPGIPRPQDFPNTEHVHHFSWYIGNFPELSHDQIVYLGVLLNEI
jgi:CDP-6-deoxy-D-xylo-4-hexulose-3-dehydrase